VWVDFLNLYLTFFHLISFQEKTLLAFYLYLIDAYSK